MCLCVCVCASVCHLIVKIINSEMKRIGKLFAIMQLINILTIFNSIQTLTLNYNRSRDFYKLHQLMTTHLRRTLYIKSCHYFQKSFFSSNNPNKKKNDVKKSNLFLLLSCSTSTILIFICRLISHWKSHSKLHEIQKQK